MRDLATRALDGARALLRSEGEFAPGVTRVPWRALAAFVALPGFFYGAVMGLWGLRPLQALYSGLKVPLLIGLTTLLALPSSYVLHALLGLRDDFGAAVRGILAAQGTLTLSLVALAPITVLAYLSSADYAFAQAFNGLVFLAASVAAQVTLARHYQRLIARDGRHRLTLAAWAALYTFIAIQLAWLLRPFIGREDMATSFLRADAVQNAYVEIGWRMWRMLRGA
ncbi:MAG: hypothetical protein R3F49_09060 [Planctomycetota bacterium]